MNIEQCKEADGLYTLLECKNRMSEFEMIVRDGEETIYEMKIKPFKRVKIDEKDFDLVCDLHESEDWECE